MTDRTCSVSGCTRPFSCRGLCAFHYTKARREGTLNGLPYLRDPSTPLVERFWAKVNKTETCWLWTAHDNGLGYGQFWVPERGRLVYAHRFAYELLVGPIPEGLSLDHLCRTPSCVNPAHLEPVTHRENTLRGVSPAAMQARRTHCPKNHEYDEENTYLDARGSRHCRTCHRERERARYQRIHA